MMFGLVAVRVIKLTNKRTRVSQPVVISSSTAGNYLVQSLLTRVTEELGEGEISSHARTSLFFSRCVPISGCRV